MIMLISEKKLVENIILRFRITLYWTSMSGSCWWKHVFTYSVRIYRANCAHA